MQKSPTSAKPIHLTKHSFTDLKAPPLCVHLLRHRTLIGRARGANLTFFVALVMNMTQEISPELETDTQLPVT